MSVTMQAKQQTKQRVLVVDDEENVAHLVSSALRFDGFETITADNGNSALAAVAEHDPDLVVLDVMMPGLDGFGLLGKLRAAGSQVPVIFLTARDGDFDMVSGLRMGADDYVTKNVSLPHLLARVSALFRRAELLREPVQSDSILERGPLTLDLNRFTIAWRGAAVDLTLTEFWLVHALAKFPGHVKNRDQLMSEAHIVVDDSTITSHIKRIRHKFGVVDAGFDCVDTVYGMGYRWKAGD